MDERLEVMLNAILQLEALGECRESATEAVLMVGYTSDGVSNQEQTRWLSWNVDGGLRGYDLARNPDLSSNMEYGAGEFPLPTGPPAGAGTQSTPKPPSMFATNRRIISGSRQHEEERVGKGSKGTGQAHSG